MKTTYPEIYLAMFKPSFRSRAPLYVTVNWQKRRTLLEESSEGEKSVCLQPNSAANDKLQINGFNILERMWQIKNSQDTWHLNCALIKPHTHTHTL